MFSKLLALLICGASMALYSRAQAQDAPDARRQETPSVLLPGSYWEKDRAPLKIGNQAPDSKLPLAPDSPLAKKTAAPLDFARFRGSKTTIVVFWAFWCDTWRDATQFLGELRPELQKRDVQIVAVAVDASQQPVARPAFASGTLFFPVVIDAKSEIVARYGVRRVPTVFLVAPNGQIRAVWEGLPSKKVLLRALKK